MNEDTNTNLIGIIVAIAIILVVTGLLVFKNNQNPNTKNETQTFSYQTDNYNENKLSVVGSNDANSMESKMESEEDKDSTMLEESSTSDTMKTMTKEEKLKTPKPETMIDKTKSYIATLKTDQGDITVKLYADKTPITANNFVYLSRLGFYNDTIFHRVINGFMIQGGDPLGNGTGGPAYKFDDEKFEGEYNRGIIAMANSGPNTNGSQFFIMHQDNPLPKNYVIFGEVTNGLDVVDKIATAETNYSPMGERSMPVNPVTVNEIIIEEN